MSKDELIKHLRKKGMNFDEFYALMGSYFNLDDKEREKLVKTTHMYKDFKKN